MSANFVKVYEIASDVPLVSHVDSAPSDKPPLALKLEVTDSSLVLSKGIPEKTVETFKKNDKGEYPLSELHDYLIKLKTEFPEERSFILDPKVNLRYEEIVKIMDSVRQLKKTDPAFFSKKGTPPDTFDERHFFLFDKIVFGNIESAVN